MKRRKRLNEFEEMNRSYTLFFPGQRYPVVVRTFGDWFVTKSGDVGAFSVRYWIDRRRLTEDDWIAHVAGKGWLQCLQDFIDALKYARKMLGIEGVKDLPSNAYG